MSRLLPLSALLVVIGSIPGLGGTLFSFGPETVSGNFYPTRLTTFDDSGPGSVATVKDVGTGSIFFNGGLAYGVNDNLLYAIGNDTNNAATLYTLDTAGNNLTTVHSLTAGVLWLSGLTLDTADSKFYAIGADPNTGSPSLYTVGAGGAALVGSIDNGFGPYSGLAYDRDTNLLYAISNMGPDDVLYDFTNAAGSLTSLFSLGGGTAFSHLGGLAYGGGGLFYTIQSTGGGAEANLRSIDLNMASATTLYDMNVAGYQNHGLALVPSVPEPAMPVLVGGGLALFGVLLGRRKSAP
jgi:hypothetical protein